MSNPIFTVLTPTYNRRRLLPRTYESLRQQTYRNFEWIVVDDGSTDGTRELIESLSHEADFTIRYFWQSNQHKKAAFNNGVRNARGELVVPLDSDDELLPQALETMNRIWTTIAPTERTRYFGITGLCVDSNGNVVGNRFPTDVMDVTSLEVHYRHHVRGEKFGCQRTEVLRQFPFREDISGYVTENTVWYAIARAGYLTRFVNQAFRIYHSTPNSLMQQSGAARYAPGLWIFAYEIVENDLAWFPYQPLSFLASAARYTRFALHMRKNGYPRPANTRLRHLWSRLLVLAMSPVGVLLYFLDRIREARTETLAKSLP